MTARKAPTLSERALYTALPRMRAGTLTVTGTDGRERVFGGAVEGPSARVELTDPAAARRIALGGAMGLAESYMDGHWSTPDLEAVLELGAVNMPEGTDTRAPRLKRPVERMGHLLRDNTPRGSKRNIEHHYDLGNDFYELWLDESMTYSCALFGEGCEEPNLGGVRVAEAPLPAAQQRKYDRILELADPKPGERLLEIGCGWGGFAVRAAKEAGCRVLGITLSREQHDFAVERVRREGLEGQVEVRLQDYRDVREEFDRIVSIEMFEAVGVRWWPAFFGALRDRLRDGGRAALQTIVIEDSRFEDYRRKPDFTQKYIFPGGMLPSPALFAEHAQAAGLEVGEPAYFGASYAATLERWLRRFDEVRDEVLALGYDERFVRMWRYYLAVCRAGFKTGSVDVMQVGLTRG